MRGRWVAKGKRAIKSQGTHKVQNLKMPFWLTGSFVIIRKTWFIMQPIKNCFGRQVAWNIINYLWVIYQKRWTQSSETKTALGICVFSSFMWEKHDLSTDENWIVLEGKWPAKYIKPSAHYLLKCFTLSKSPWNILKETKMPRRERIYYSERHTTKYG